MRISVCISTFHRPEGLAQLLASLARQVVPADVAVDLVVVNNDPDDRGPARVCAEAARALPFPIMLLDEPERGLAAPRNRALDHALPGRDAVAFIDDDSVARPGWLAALLSMREVSGAEIVTGPVVPAWESPPPPAWLEELGHFAPRRHPAGAAVAGVFTNNVLIDAEILRRTGIRFDLRFGLRGGEDAHFFRRLRTRGARTAWAPDAVVEDLVPVERTTERWLVMRHRRTGMSTALIERDLRPALVAWPYVLARAGAWVALGTGLRAVGALRGRATRVRGRCWTAWGRGLAEGLFGRCYLEYLEER